MEEQAEAIFGSTTDTWTVVLKSLASAKLRKHANILVQTNMQHYLFWLEHINLRSFQISPEDPVTNLGWSEHLLPKLFNM